METIKFNRCNFAIKATAALALTAVVWMSGCSNVISGDNESGSLHPPHMRTYTLTVSRNHIEGGTVTVNGSTTSGTTIHNGGTSVTVVAHPAYGYMFTGWSGASMSTNTNITITMIGDRTLTANFWSPPSTITYSRFTDSRNNRTYRTVVIGGRTWFAENLNYRNPDWFHNDYVASIPWGSGTFGSWCYNNSSNCDTYGRLYTWDAAMDNACPVGWRLPTLEDWRGLFLSVGGINHGEQWFWWSNAGIHLKASQPAWDGNDTHGFSALPGGDRWLDGNFGELGWGHWWSATEDATFSANSVHMHPDHTDVAETWNGKNFGLSVRCVRDN